MQPELTKFVSFNLTKIPQRELNNLTNEFVQNFAPQDVNFNEFLALNNALFFNDSPHFVKQINNNNNFALNEGITLSALINPNWNNQQTFNFLQSIIKGDQSNE